MNCNGCSRILLLLTSVTCVLHRHSVEVKEVRLRPVTEPHDYEVKVKAAKGFLAKGSKVKLTMQFSGREMRFKEQGKEMMLVSFDLAVRVR